MGLTPVDEENAKAAVKTILAWYEAALGPVLQDLVKACENLIQQPEVRRVLGENGL